MSEINFTSSGKGEVIVLLHGFCETHHIWLGIQPELAKNYRVISPDLPGYGDSPLSQTDFSLAEVADKIHAWLLTMGINRCTIIGHSMGGYMALLIAQRNKGFVDRIALVHSTMYSDNAVKKNTRNKTIDFINEKGLERFVDSFFTNLFYTENLGKEDIKHALAGISNRAKLLKKSTVTAYIKAMRDRESSEYWVNEYLNPFLIIAGVDDVMVPITDSREQGKLPKNCLYVELNETGHMGMFEAPSQTVNAIFELMQLQVGTR